MCLEPTEFTVVAEWRPHSLGDCQVLFQRTVGAKVEVVIKQIRLKENLLFFSTLAGTKRQCILNPSDEI